MGAGRQLDSGSRKEGRKDESRIKRESGYIWGAYEKGHPPPFGERKECFAPIIFRTENTAKSRLGKVGKNFGKNLWENVSGEEKAPNLMERGRSAKIRKISLRMQR